MAVPKKQTEAVARSKSAGMRKRNTMVLTGAAAAYGSGWLFAKNPQFATIGNTNISTGMAIGATATFLGMFGRGRLSATIGGVGLGFLFPALDDMGKSAG